MPLTQFRIDDGSHNMDGLRIYAQDRSERVEAFIGRKVMDDWTDPVGRSEGAKAFFEINTTRSAS